LNKLLDLPSHGSEIKKGIVLRMETTHNDKQANLKTQQLSQGTDPAISTPPLFAHPSSDISTTTSRFLSTEAIYDETKSQQLIKIIADDTPHDSIFYPLFALSHCLHGLLNSPHQYPDFEDRIRSLAQEIIHLVDIC